MIWLNKILEQIKKDKKPPFLVSDYKTPSGRIHVGSLRGVIIHDIVYKALKEKFPADFKYGFDDFDPMDTFPQYLPAKFKKYLGMPLCDIPAPEEAAGIDRAENFAQFYALQFQKVFNQLGAKPEILWTSKLYRSGQFNQVIKVALENADQIRKIYREISGSAKPADWYPFQVICPKCGKIGTTRVFNFQDNQVEFSCEKKLVEWAFGCGYRGKISPYNGAGKLPWKIEWAAKWLIFNTTFEAAGKDHYTKGGSRDIAEAVARKVYQIEPPAGLGYEFFLVSGKKMASSKGLGVAAAEIAEMLPPELLRFLMVKTLVARPIEFNPEDETIPRLYDFYDQAAGAFWSGSKDQENLAQVYFYSQIKKPVQVFHLRFSKVANLLQMPNVDLREKAEQEKGEKLTGQDIEDLEQRKRYAEKWLAKYAPESAKFKIDDNLPETAKDLNSKQKEFLAGVLKIVKERQWSGEELHSQIHELKKQLKLDPREAFSAIYLVFTGKDSGPQAGWFLVSLGRDFVIKRLEEAI